MNSTEKLVDIDLIREMLYDDDAYVKEFAEASVASFTEFKAHFKESLINRDMDELRKAGHKIKPVSLMLNLNPVVDMYETSKTYLLENESTEALADLIRQMEHYIDRVLAEFTELANSIN
jgi:hypothetical protein